MKYEEKTGLAQSPMRAQIGQRTRQYEVVGGQEEGGRASFTAGGTAGCPVP